MKERDELRPEDRVPASRESKDEFLNNVDILTERGYVNDRGARIADHPLKHGRKVELHFNSADAMRDLEDNSDDPTKAQMNLLEPINEDQLRMKTCYLRRSGAIEQHTTIRDLKKMREEGLRSFSDSTQSDEDFRKDLERHLEDIRHTMKSMEKAVQLGLAFVSEADLKALNEILRSLIAEQKSKKTK